MEYKRIPQKFVFTGLDLNHPVDLMPPGKAPYARNIRRYTEGKINTRTGLNSVNLTALDQTFIHSIFRMNDYIENQFVRFVGAGGKIYAGQTEFTEVDSGYYPYQPQCFVPYRPESATQPWCYISDSNKMQKINSSGDKANIGIFPPYQPPVVELLEPLYSVPAGFEANLGWGNDRDAGSVTRTARLTGVAVEKAVYVNGNATVPGWAVVSFASGNVQEIVKGMRLIFGSLGSATVEEVHKVWSASTSVTVASIIYDDETGPGLCTVQPSVALSGIRRNSMVVIGAEYVRVESVTNGPGGISSFRCSTTLVHAATEIINPVGSGNVFVWAPANVVPTTAVTSWQQEFSFSAGGSQTGIVMNNVGSPGYNLGQVGSRPISPDDWMHVGIKVSDPTKIDEIKLVLDVDSQTSSSYAATDGTKNAYYKTFRRADFQALIGYDETAEEVRLDAIINLKKDQTALQTETTNAPSSPFGVGQESTPDDIFVPEQTAPPIQPETSPSTQMITGNDQWCEFRFKVSDLIKIGSDQKVNLSSVKAIQLRFMVNDDCDIKFANLWVGGSYGPDSGDIYAPFIYRFRYRASVTGAKSLPGPSTYSGIQSLRQGISITCPVDNADSQADKIDIERLGGQNTEWHYVGTTNISSPTFVDDQLNAAVKINPALETDAYQPFPLSDQPKTYVVNVAGTAVKWISDPDTIKFNNAWARGTIVIIGGVATTLRSSPASDTLLFITDSLGSLTNAVMEIPEPIVQSRALPVMWGPFYETLFAVGNPQDIGSIYFTKPGDPDSAPETNRLEITSPSEALMGGCVYDSKCYVWSDKRLFQIFPTDNPSVPFRAVEVPGGQGLFSQWGIAVGPKIWYVGVDGIYETVGGESVCISDDLQQIFPQGDKPEGVLTNGVYPVKTRIPGVQGAALNLRLTYHNRLLFFDCINTLNQPRTFVYDIDDKLWYYDTYFNSVDNHGLLCHFSESGLVDHDEVATLLAASNFGLIFTHGGTTDAGTVIDCEMWTPSVDAGDARAKKVYGDMVFDLDTHSIDVLIEVWQDYFQTSLTTKTYNTTTRTITVPLDLNAGAGQIIRNLGVKLIWSGAAPEAFSWEPSILQRPEDTFLRATDWTDGGHGGAKLLRGFLVEADSDGEERSIILQGDQTNLQTYSMTFSGQMLKAFSVNPTQFASLMRLLPQNEVAWRNFRVSYIFDPVPENASIVSSFTDGGYHGAKWVQGVRVEALGTSVAYAHYDGGISGAEININQPGDFPYRKAYSFSTPFIAHTMRLTPNSALRLGEVEWIFEPMPESATYWITQPTTHDLPGWQFLKDCYIAHISTSDIIMTVYVDGVGYALTIPHSNGAYAKTYIVFQTTVQGKTLKGKSFQYKLISDEGFRLFVKDCEVRVHSTMGGGYQIRKPFGDISREMGAKI